MTYSEANEPPGLIAARDVLAGYLASTEGGDADDHDDHAYGLAWELHRAGLIKPAAPADA